MELCSHWPYTGGAKQRRTELGVGAGVEVEVGAEAGISHTASDTARCNSGYLVHPEDEAQCQDHDECGQVGTDTAASALATPASALTIAA